VKLWIIGLAGLAISATSASALEAKVEKDAAAGASAVWTAIGGFCGIATWHPAVAKCVLLEKDGKSYRELTLKDGARLLEELVQYDKAAMTYSYTIVEGPLPVANYRSTLSVADDGKGSKITWTGSFDAKGAADADAVKTISGIYEAGASELAKVK
jgi:hypothetical protein